MEQSALDKLIRCGIIKFGLDHIDLPQLIYSSFLRRQFDYVEVNQSKNTESNV